MKAGPQEAKSFIQMAASFLSLGLGAQRITRIFDGAIAINRLVRDGPGP